MNLAPLAQLQARHEALIAALDSNDVDAIGDACAGLDDTLRSLGSVQAWVATPELKAAAERIGSLADAAAMRLNVLADQARRRADALAMARGMTPTYSRS